MTVNMRISKSIWILLSGCCMLLYIVYFRLTIRNDYRSANFEDFRDFSNVSKMKFILQWTLPDTIPFVYLGVGQQTFLDRNCTYKNCFVTSQKDYVDITNFHGILFHGPELTRAVVRKSKFDIPLKRSPEQYYIFTSIESSHYYPANSEQFNNFFNWTWTYKLDSDVAFWYITVRDKTGNIIGPKKDMSWIKVDDMKDIEEDFIERLKGKNKAAAWIVSNCNALSMREKIVKQVQKELKPYNLSVDVYGSCGDFACPKNSAACFEKLKSDYYFYFSFENSFSDDYVTEKLLHALQNYAVPVVYGSANYTRFMPDGIYLNGRDLGPRNLAKKMKYLIDNPRQYNKYFKWHNHYSYHYPEDAPDSDPYCKLCEMLNTRNVVSSQVHNEFRTWWNT